MARLFDDVATEYLEHAAAVSVTLPLGMACWFLTDDATISQALISIYTASSSNNNYRLEAGGAVVGDPVLAAYRTGSELVAETTTGYSTGVWTHAAGLFLTSISRSAYINGGSKGTNSGSSSAPTSMDRTAIGRHRNSAKLMSGRIAEAGIWNLASWGVDDASRTAAWEQAVAAMAAGVSPGRFPLGRLAYWPLWGTHSPEIDLAGGLYPMTATGTVRAEHAPVRPFASRFWGSYPVIEAAGGPTFQPAWASQANSLIGLGAFP